MGIWLAVAVAAKGTLVADVVAADTVAGVAPCTMGTTLVAGVMHNIEPGGRNAVCCCNCMLARACWYWKIPVLKTAVAPLVFQEQASLVMGEVQLEEFPWQLQWLQPVQLQPG